MFETESFVVEITSERKVVFSRNTSNAFIGLSANERLFILAGTWIRHSDEEDKTFDSSNVAYTWIKDNELYYVNVKQFKLNGSVRRSDSVSVEPFYPICSGDGTCHK